MRETYVITGASRGIGKFLADYYDKKGKFVIRASRSNGFDVTNDEDVEVLASIPEQVNVLINCAGIAAMNAAVLMTPSKTRDIVNTNFIGTANVTTAMFPKLRKAYGRVINFSSVAVGLNLEGEAVYAASKAAVESLTRTLSKEWGGYGIRVNCIAANPIRTDLINGVSQEKLDAVINQQAIKEFGSMDDVVNICDFFIDRRSGFITGQVIKMGGP
jgi:3-oxoacyl-[acyl-carrier protein] reductase